MSFDAKQKREADSGFQLGSVDISTARKPFLLGISQEEDWRKTLFKNVWKVEMKNTGFYHSDAGCSSLYN